MNKVYKPCGETIKKFLSSDSFVRGIMGPIGSGKSTACCIDIIQRASKQVPSIDGKRKSRWAVIRNTYPELKTTTIKTWHQWVSPAIGEWKSEGPPTHKINTNTMELEVIFLALDRAEDTKKLLSLELTGAWINEAREIGKPVLDVLSGRVGRYPPVSELTTRTNWYGIIMDTNPTDTDHWWYRLAEEETPEGFEFFKQPSGLSENAENIENLPENYYKKAALGKSEEWINIYIHGQYGFSREGKPVFPEYSDTIHCQTVNKYPNLPINIGIDFGLTPAAVFGQRTPNGRWIILSELIAEDMGAERFAIQIKEHLQTNYPNMQTGTITGDPAGESRSQADERTPIQMLREHGINAVPARTNSFLERREAVAKFLTKLVDGNPALTISPNCRTLRKGLAGGYSFKRLRISNEERYKDSPDKNMYSHVCDALQYLILSDSIAAVVENKQQSVKKEPIYRNPLSHGGTFMGL